MSMATESGAVPLLEARGLVVRFGKVTALNGLDLTAPPGQVEVHVVAFDSGESIDKDHVVPVGRTGIGLTLIHRGQRTGTRTA